MFPMLPNQMPRFVLSRDGAETGIPTGKIRACQLEGCGGCRIGVRWPSNKITWPCMKGLVFIDKDSAQIE